MDTIRENEVQIAKDNSSIMQLEKFQSTLESEIKNLESQDINKSDTDKLDELKKLSTSLEKERSKDFLKTTLLSIKISSKTVSKVLKTMFHPLIRILK